jgi:HEAT repeat protein
MQRKSPKMFRLRSARIWAAPSPRLKTGLTGSITNTDTNARCAAIRAIGQVGCLPDLLLLLPHLDDDSVVIRRAAVDAIYSLASWGLPRVRDEANLRERVREIKAREQSLRDAVSLLAPNA